MCEALRDKRQGRGVVGKDGLERRRALPASQERCEGLLEEGWAEGRRMRG